MSETRFPIPDSPFPSLAFVFPGQGSQSVGMLAELGAEFPEVRQAFDEASDGAGLDLWSLAQNGPEAELGRTENTQPALLAASVAVWRVWRAPLRSRSEARSVSCRGWSPPVWSAGRPGESS